MKVNTSNKYGKRNGDFKAGSRPGGIHKFARGNALSHKTKKEEEELERFRKHKKLNNYARLCRAEGITSDRVNVNKNKIKELDGNGVPIRKVLPEKHDNNPFKASQEKANKNKLEKIESINNRNNQLQEKISKDKIREQNKKIHMKRTKKGQPILHNQINSILSKLQSEN
jgi:hypothetical protein